MSWDVHLTDDRGHCEGDWGYTHNCNGMANEAARRAGLGQQLHDGSVEWWRRIGRDDVADELAADPSYGSWWSVLDGMDGPDGAKWLGSILAELRADPMHFRAMNPDNGWGDFDSLVAIIDEMRRAVPEWPCTWSASG